MLSVIGMLEVEKIALSDQNKPETIRSHPILQYIIFILYINAVVMKKIAGTYEKALYLVKKWASLGHTYFLQDHK